MCNSNQEFSTELLQVYYARLFPYQQMFDWLSYGNDAAASPDSPFYKEMDKDYFLNREWSFTIEDDIYIRYQCFKGTIIGETSEWVLMWCLTKPLHMCPIYFSNVLAYSQPPLTLLLMCHLSSLPCSSYVYRPRRDENCHSETPASQDRYWCCVQRSAEGSHNHQA